VTNYSKYIAHSTLPQEQGCTIDQLWEEFNQLYPTEKDCCEELYKKAQLENLLNCRSCGSQPLLKTCPERVFRCHNCKKKRWLTGGTFFHRVRLIKSWLAAIWLTERGAILTSTKFQKLLNIAQSSALNILRKIRMVMQDLMDDTCSSAPSSLFSMVVSKRSRETPARLHPTSEEEEKSENNRTSTHNSRGNADLNVNNAALLRTEACNLTDSPFANLSQPGETATKEIKLERKIYDLLSDNPMSVDALLDLTGTAAGPALAALTMLELAGLATRIVGDYYLRTQSETRSPMDNNPTTAPADSVEKLPTIIVFVRFYFNGISRKYLQTYLAAHWCKARRTPWGPGTLLRSCLQKPPITYQEILDYVTPTLVKVCYEPL